VTALVACRDSHSSSDHLATAAGEVTESLAPRYASAETPNGGTPGGITSLAPLAKQVTPAVVAIQSLINPDSEHVANNGGQGPPQGVPPGFFPPGFGPPPDEGPRGALGTGFIVSNDGYILTNNHVVEGSERLTVGLPDRRIFTAKVIGHDPAT